MEKAGRVNLRAGEGRGFDALLSNLVRLKASESAYGKGRVSDGAAFPAFAAASSARARPQNISFGAGDCGR